MVIYLLILTCDCSTVPFRVVKWSPRSFGSSKSVVLSYVSQTSLHSTWQSPLVVFTITFATVSDLVEFLPSWQHTRPYLLRSKPSIPYVQYRKWFHTFLLWDSLFRLEYSFLTYTEQELWHIGSLAVTVLPITTFTLAVIVDSIYPNPLHRSTLQFSVHSRMCLQGFYCLDWHCHFWGIYPPTAFIAINWTKYYPHTLWLIVPHTV